MHRPSLLQIATRLHHALLREIGTGIDIGAMLSEQRYAKEVLYLCRACDDPEIHALVTDFEACSPAGDAMAGRLQRPAKAYVHRLSGVARAARGGTAASPAQAHSHPRDFAFSPARVAGARGRSSAPLLPTRLSTKRFNPAH